MPKQLRMVVSAGIAVLLAVAAYRIYKCSPAVIEIKKVFKVSLSGCGPRCPQRTIAVEPPSIFTGPSNARVGAGDGEVGSDDWTSIRINYATSISANDRAVEMTINWHTQEKNRNQSNGDTRIDSSRTIPLFHVDGSCPDSRILSVEGLTTTDTKEQLFRGERHGPQGFPDFGSLRNIEVQFDGRGGNDHQRQELKASLSPFRVVVSESP